MISVEHMDELITRFNSGELDIMDIIEHSYFGGRADAIDEVCKQISERVEYWDSCAKAMEKGSNEYKILYR